MHDEMDEGEGGRWMECSKVWGKVGGGDGYGKCGTKQKREGKMKTQPHLLGRLGPLPVVLEVATVSRLSMGNVSVFFFTSADPGEKRAELGTGGGGGMRAGRIFPSLTCQT